MMGPPGCPLTGREFEVLAVLSEGLTYRQIAARLHVEATTVRSHVHAAIRRLGVVDSAQAVIYCFKAGWMDIGLGPEPRALVPDFNRLEELLSELVPLVKERRQLTDQHRAYLEAFDDLLLAREDWEKIDAREQMDRALGPVLDRADVPWQVMRRRRGDVVELLVEFVSRR